jgi:hypothetical protein
MYKSHSRLERVDTSARQGKSVFGPVVKESIVLSRTSSGSLGTRVERRGNKANDRMDVGWQNELPDVQIKQQNGSTHAADGGSLLPWGERVENQPLFVPCVETVRKSIGSLTTHSTHQWKMRGG